MFMRYCIKAVIVQIPLSLSISVVYMFLSLGLLVELILSQKCSVDMTGQGRTGRGTAGQRDAATGNKSVIFHLVRKQLVMLR